MILIGLAGPAGAGKDTVADYLVKTYGFIKVSWADALREEVRAAFGLENYDLMLNRATKDTYNSLFALENCADSEFVAMTHEMCLVQAGDDPQTPRQILQWWGTEYRRAQNPGYWTDQLGKTITRYRESVAYPEQRPQLFVVSDTRFENERTRIIDGGFAYYEETPVEWDGNIWHIRRETIEAPTDTHQSARPLPVLEGERELYNNSTIDKLHQGIDLLLSTGAKFVRCEPMAPDFDPCAPCTSDIAKATTEDERTIAVEYAKGH